MFQVIGGRSVQAARVLAPRSAVLVEAVRGRKSRTDPVAKSKVGRIKVPPPVDPVEMVVLKERYGEYQMIMRALRWQKVYAVLEFKEEMLRKKYEEDTGSLAEERARQEAQEHRVLMDLNHLENQRILKLTRTRAARNCQRKEKEILKLQEDVKNFITLENLDQRIEEALDNPQNYNFAIDKQGKVVKQTMLQ
ncbi:hypothetical protein KUCAC02_025842 [Chaenocephalus aceratus]|uniref:Uncharacterized protein n=1 Tax=Chaenocephalus aceratus TaxID=36190 RepID=A0ACB9VVQ4_CHAAC|nr:hypothetical protein KUCAC02_025842 [Chaenocephalus aceratus]